jgi:elongation factor G
VYNYFEEVYWMKVYPTSSIRNIALVSHGGTGKTSLAEAMLYSTGVLKRLGKVDDGTSVGDYLPEEVKKKFTISASLIPCEYKDCKINLVDTPGYADFYFEVAGAMRVVDSMLMLFSRTAVLKYRHRWPGKIIRTSPKLLSSIKWNVKTQIFIKSWRKSRILSVTML